MNVTLKLPDELCKLAKHRAIDESKSLSKWIAEIVEKEISKPPQNSGHKSWMEAMKVEGAPDWFYEKEFPLEDRKAIKEREFEFED